MLGALLKVQVEIGVPVLVAPSMRYKADILCTLAKRLKRNGVGEKHPPRIQYKPKLLSQREQQMYVVASLPGVGDKMATRLLKHFGTARNIFRASETELESVEGIGRTKAERISQVLDAHYMA